MTDQIERDVRDHAKTISELVNEIGRLKSDRNTDDAVRKVTDEYLNERLERIEGAVRDIYKLGKWILAAVGSTLIVAIVGFVIKGGLIG